MILSFEKTYSDLTLWSVTGVFSVLLFFVGIAIFALMLRQKRRGGALAALFALLLSYGMFQCIAAFFNETEYGLTSVRSAGRLAISLPDWLVLSTCAVLAAGEALLLGSIVAHRKKHVTLMSIKEAADGFSMGVLCYAPNGRILLVNRAMEKFCERLTGEMLTDGMRFAEKLHTGCFLSSCRVIDAEDALVIQISDNTVWTVAEETIPYENIGIRGIMVSDITDDYRKTLELRRVQKEVSALNARLVRTNREIVALTAEQELLNAKVKIHDELGQNLLSIKRMILNESGTESEKEDMAERLRENIEFLKGETAAVADEYELMISTAKRLGVDVTVSGALPQTESLKQVVATGIHECFTNTLRHAHGNRLDIGITESEDAVTVVFTNNGEPPTGEIREKGGLGLLRALTERAGGKMTVSSETILTITLELPKEV